MASPDYLALACSGACCLGMWGTVAGAGGWAASRRVKRIEARLGKRAEPADESRYLWYAGAASLWLVGLILAGVGLRSDKWARTGRDALFIFFAQITIVTLGAIAIVSLMESGGGNPLPLVAFACVVAASGLTVAPLFAVKWAFARSKRIARLPTTGPAPGAERYAIYLASCFIGFAGLIAAVVYNKPENVRVGAVALTISMAQLWCIALAVCIGLPILVAVYV